MTKGSTEKTAGQRIIAGLVEFRDALASGAGLDERFTVRTVSIREPRRFAARDVARLRHKMNASQSVFARLLGVSPVLARQWESGVRSPSALACRLLEVASRDPQAYVGSLLGTGQRKQAKRLSRSAAVA